MKRLASCWLVLAASACTGDIGHVPGPGHEPAPAQVAPSAMPGQPTAAATPMPPAVPLVPPQVGPPGMDLEPRVARIECADPTAPRGVARRGVRRLDRDELGATFADLSKSTKAFNTQFAFFPDLPEMDDVASFNPLHTYDQAFPWALTVDAVAQSPTVAADLGFPCLNLAPPADSCLHDFFTRLGRRAWRRPLTPAEVSGLTSQVKSVPGPSARYTAISLLLQAPDFLFHIENGVSTQGVRVRLGDHEIANRIAYAAIGSMPDPALADAADRGELKTLPQIEPHVRRLLESPRGKIKLRKFFEEWLELEVHLSDPSGQAIVRAQLYGGEKYPKFDNPGAQYAQEFWDYVNHVIWAEKGTFRDLMSRRIAFPKSTHMQRVLRVASVSDGVTPVDAPDYPGLPFRPALLVQPVTVTSPITRGVFVLRRILCEDLPSPDFTVVNARFDEIGELNPIQLPNHEINARLTGAPQCGICHAKINPIGFVLEGYDTLGMRRQQQAVFSDKYPGTTVLATHPLPYPVKGGSIDNPAQPITYSSPADLSSALGSSPKPASCAMTYLFRHLERRREAQPDACAINQWAKLATEGKPMAEVLVQSIANEDIFWRGAP